MKVEKKVKRNDVLIHATPWMNLDNMVLSERSVTQNHRLYDCIYIRYPE